MRNFSDLTQAKFNQILQFLLDKITCFKAEFF